MIKLELTQDYSTKVIAELNVNLNEIAYDDIHEVELAIINKLSEITKISINDMDVDITKKMVYMKTDRYEVEATYLTDYMPNYCIVYRVIERTFNFEWIVIE